MQPIAKGKRDDGESAAVQKQPGSTKTHENYEAAILFFVHAYLILSMHLAQVNIQSFILCFKLMYYFTPFCV